MSIRSEVHGDCVFGTGGERIEDGNVIGEYFLLLTAIAGQCEKLIEKVDGPADALGFPLDKCTLVRILRIGSARDLDLLGISKLFITRPAGYRGSNLG